MSRNYIWWSSYFDVYKFIFLLFLGQTKLSEENDETKPIYFFLNYSFCLFC